MSVYSALVSSRGCALTVRKGDLHNQNWDEAARLAALNAYAILDSEQDGPFKNITTIAAKLFSVPTAFISLVDADTIRFRAAHGMALADTARVPGFCGSAVLQDKPWLVVNASADQRAAANPLVTGAPGLQFYLGIPLITPEGHAIGVLGVADLVPRRPTRKQIEHLKHLAAAVIGQMELRMTARQAIAEATRMVEEKNAELSQSRLLAREIDHRVMNSLQLVSSMLMLQSRSAESADTAEQLAVASGRISAVARSHQHIYLAADAGAVRENCQAYLKRLCLTISEILHFAEGRLNVEGEALDLPSDKLVPIGLIVNELITNAAKQGATNIRVTIQLSGESQIMLRVSDDGPGLPTHFSIENSKGLGMKVITSLARQLNGTLSAERCDWSDGAAFTVVFTAPQNEDFTPIIA